MRNVLSDTTHSTPYVVADTSYEVAVSQPCKEALELFTAAFDAVIHGSKGSVARRIFGANRAGEDFALACKPYMGANAEVDRMMPNVVQAHQWQHEIEVDDARR
ncbi:MAG: hypothetical protein HYR72_00550 [Deltaproteobacteria bacterium]|nr:hypothetical protein [Deltaproteobacteria bacterium]MBI3389480.1 hypothetical protein [Deltaproteobacteria bacterium]